MRYEANKMYSKNLGNEPEFLFFCFLDILTTKKYIKFSFKKKLIDYYSRTFLFFEKYI